MKRICILTTLLLVLAGCAAREQVGEAAPALAAQSADSIRSVWSEDLDTLQEALARYHPAWNEARFLRDRQELEQYLADNGSDATTFYFGVQRLLAGMGDAHTHASPPRSGDSPVLPIWMLRPLEDGLYVFGIHSDYSRALGCRLTAINGVPVELVLEQMSPWISRENDTRLRTAFCDKLRENPELLIQAGIVGDVASVPLSFESPQGERFTLTLNTVGWDDPVAYTKGVWLWMYEAPTSPLDNYSYHRLDARTLYVQYAWCQEREDLSVAQFADALEAELRGGGYDTLLFDLRFNAGGMHDLFLPVVDRVGALGNELNLALYCLIGDGTFSTAVMHAVELRDYGAVLVGRPTGNSINFYADTAFVTLPLSGIHVSVSTGLVVNDSRSNADSLRPQVSVVHRIESYLSGEDCDVQAALLHRDRNRG